MKTDYPDNAYGYFERNFAIIENALKSINKNEIDHLIDELWEPCFPLDLMQDFFIQILLYMEIWE